MAERPILFSGAMVRAILAGTKTQTRRALKVQPIGQAFGGQASLTRSMTKPVFYAMWDAPAADGSTCCLCPYGVPGDRLWVRETWAYGVHAMAADRDEEGPFVYAADGTTQGRLCDRWRPSIHMPRAASRITLEVTGVRVDRLQDISADDCVDEGIDPCTVPGIGSDASLVTAYRQLWESINGPGSWDANPFVWVVEFRRLS